MRPSTAVFAFLLLPTLTACNYNDTDLKGRIEALEAQNAQLAAEIAALKTGTLSFSQILGTIDDAQVPDDITIAFAATAGDADTLDGYHANEIAESGSFLPFVSHPWYQPAAPFQYLRTGSRVRVTGVLNLIGPTILPETFQVDGLPYRTAPFAGLSDAIGTATASLTFVGGPESTDATLTAAAGLPSVSVALLPLGISIRDGGTIALEFSYDVDP